MKLTEQGKAPNAVIKRIALLEGEISEFNRQIGQIQYMPTLFTSDDLANLKNMFITYMATQDTLEARNLINAVIRKIEIDDEKIEIVFNNGIHTTSKTAEIFK